MTTPWRSVEDAEKANLLSSLVTSDQLLSFM